MKKRDWTGMPLPQTAEELERHFPGGLDQYPPEAERYAREMLPDYLLVRKGTRKRIARCSHCGETMDLSAIWPDVYKTWKHGDEVNCPRCGKKVKVITRNGVLWDKGFFYWWERSDIDRSSIICRGIVIDRGLGREFAERERMFTDSAIVFSYGRGAAMAILDGKWDSCGKEWKEGYRMVKDVHSRMGVFTGNGWQNKGAEIGSPTDCLREAVKGTPFQWCRWHRFERMRRAESDVYIKIFQLFAKYRAWEYLSKMGLERLLLDYAEGSTNAWDLFNWRGKTIEAIFRKHLTKDDKAFLLEAPVKETCLRAWLAWKRFHREAALRDAAEIWPPYWNTVRAEEERTKDVMKLVSPGKWKRYGEKEDCDLSEYTDYIEQCRKLGMEMTKDVLWPKDFQAAHRRTGQRIQLIKNRELEKRYEERRPALAEKYRMRSERYGLRIVVPEKLYDLIEEGKQQHNCVGGYMERVADGKTDVVFLRRDEDPQKSYVTVEVNPRDGHVLQAREKYNQKISNPQALSFLREFEARARRGAEA